MRYKFTNDPKNSIFKAQNLAVVDEDEFDLIFDNREEEADNFYWRITPLPISDELRNLQRQAFSGLLWTKQFYNFTYDAWYNGDANVKPRPPLIELMAGTRTGSTFTSKISYQCPTNGSIHFLLHGILRFTAFL